MKPCWYDIVWNDGFLSDIALPGHSSSQFKLLSRIVLDFLHMRLALTGMHCNLVYVVLHT